MDRNRFAINAIGIHFTAYERRIKKIIKQQQQAFIDNQFLKNPDLNLSVTLVGPNQQDITETAEMMFGIYERGLEDAILVDYKVVTENKKKKK